MKTAAKVLIIISMVCGALFIFPLVVGILALQKLEDAKSADELKTMAIITLLFCNTLAGILMLCIKDEDLAENSTQNFDQPQPQQNLPQQNFNQNQSVTSQNAQPQNDQPEPTPNKDADLAKMAAELKKVQDLFDSKMLTKEEYESIRKSIIEKYLD